MNKTPKTGRKLNVRHCPRCGAEMIHNTDCTDLDIARQWYCDRCGKVVNIKAA